MQTITYKGHEIKIVLAISGGYYCKWDAGETRIMDTEASAIFLAEKMIEAPKIYGDLKREEWDYLFG